ncbi:DoxX family protein [Gordonia sp. NPDC062954]|uniref:DoxX family protein n=1 Tax=Gordonia sp. NPDC062954 TaxID=3364003 RepID=UPI0037C91AB9
MSIDDLAWVGAWVLFAVHLTAGMMKVLVPIPRIPAAMAWVHQAPAWQVRAVGVIALIGAFGIVLPGLTGLPDWLGVAAAFGLAAFQVGAAVAHWPLGITARRQIPINLALAAIGLLVGWAWLA